MSGLEIHKALKGMDLQEYLRLLDSGMFYEWYPEATGEFRKDTEEDEHNTRES